MFSYPAHYISVKRAGKSDAKKDAADTFNYCFHVVCSVCLFAFDLQTILVLAYKRKHSYISISYIKRSFYYYSILWRGVRHRAGSLVVRVQA